MKNKLNLFVVATFLAVFSIGGFVFAQKAGEGKDGEDPGIKIINGSTRMVNGKLFPKTGDNPTVQSICNVGDVRTVKALDINEKRPAAYPKGKILLDQDYVYSPPSGIWVVSTAKVVDLSMSGGSRSLTLIPGNYSFTTSSEFQQTYTSLSSYIANLNILNKWKIALDLNIKNSINNYQSYTYSIAASHSTAKLHVTLTSFGILDGSGSWWWGFVETSEVCAPPEIQNAGVFKQFMKNWIDETVKKLPRDHPIKAVSM